MKLTKFLAVAFAALAFVGCGNEEPTPATPTPAPAVGGITLKASTNASVAGEYVTFTVEDSEGQDVTGLAQIYDPELNELLDKKFTTDEPGTYSFFATLNGNTSNTVLVRFLATMPNIPADPDAANLWFNHRPLVIDHTGVNCGACPNAMDNLLSLEKSTMHGKYNEVTCHAGDYAGGDPASSTAATTLYQYQSKYVSGWPTIIVNFNNKSTNYLMNSIVTELNKVLQPDGADVGISLAVEGDQDAIYCAAQVKSAVEKEYFINAWLLESNIYSPNQQGATKDYHMNYNYALRNFSEKVSSSNIAGTSLGVIAEGETVNYGCEIEMISPKWVSANMGVLVVVCAKDSNNRIDVVNSAYCKIGDTMPYEYL